MAAENVLAEGPAQGEIWSSNSTEQIMLRDVLLSDQEGIITSGKADMEANGSLQQLVGFLVSIGVQGWPHGFGGSESRAR